MLSPVPSSTVAEYTGPATAYAVPGGGGGGGSTELAVSQLFGVPMIPGAPPGSPVIDLDYDACYGSLMILVDGPGKDIAAELDPQYGYFYYFQDAAMGAQQAQAFATKCSMGMSSWFAMIKDNMGGDSYTIKNLYNNSQTFTVQSPGGSEVTNDFKAMMYDSNTDSLYAVEEQSSGTGNITIHKVPVSGGSNSTITVSGSATGGGYTGLTALSSSSYFGAYNDLSLIHISEPTRPY